MGYSEYTYCPICSNELEVRETTPCMDCGAFPREVKYLQAGKRSFAEFEIIEGLTLVLCSSCHVDFGSYKAEMWNLPNNRRLGYGDIVYIRDIDPVSTKDKFCPHCGHRLAFLKFWDAVKTLYEPQLI
ncbi:MAG: hypothetical protein GY754_00420 [bacterium]|nr:hypothetical protein [bacterium]